MSRAHKVLYVLDLQPKKSLVKYLLDQGFDVYDDAYGKGTDTGQFVFPERRGADTVAAALACPGSLRRCTHRTADHARYYMLKSERGRIL